jgi:ubiquinone/menaquinone biosynthesis C-methylase UbiE
MLEIIDMLEEDKRAKVLDLGCYEDTITKEVARKVKTIYIFGIDIMPNALLKAKQKGIETIRADMNFNLPFADNSFDVIFSNHVIEHLIDTDKFADEIYRILKPNGYAIISTENLSAFHNLFALFFGYPAFSQQISHRKSIRNPISRLYLDDTVPDYPGHMRIFTYFGLKMFFELYKFKVDRQTGIGLYPFPPVVSRIVEKMDPIHTNIITIKIRKAGNP